MKFVASYLVVMSILFVAVHFRNPRIDTPEYAVRFIFWPILVPLWLVGSALLWIYYVISLLIIDLRERE